MQHREVKEPTRKIAVREALCLLVPFREENAKTREELWSGLPEELRVNEKRFNAELEEGVGKLWTRKGGTARVPAQYWRNRL